MIHTVTEGQAHADAHTLKHQALSMHPWPRFTAVGRRGGNPADIKVTGQTINLQCWPVHSGSRTRYELRECAQLLKRMD